MTIDVKEKFERVGMHPSNSMYASDPFASTQSIATADNERVPDTPTIGPFVSFSITSATDCSFIMQTDEERSINL